MKNNTDIVILEKETNNIVAIITNDDLAGKEFIGLKGLDVIVVDNRKPYLVGNDETGRVQFRNPDSKILYMEDYL